MEFRSDLVFFFWSRWIGAGLVQTLYGFWSGKRSVNLPDGEALTARTACCSLTLSSRFVSSQKSGAGFRMASFWSGDVARALRQLAPEAHCLKLGGWQAAPCGPALKRHGCDLSAFVCGGARDSPK